MPTRETRLDWLPDLPPPLPFPLPARLILADLGSRHEGLSLGEGKSVRRGKGELNWSGVQGGGGSNTQTGTARSSWRLGIPHSRLPFPWIAWVGASAKARAEAW